MQNARIQLSYFSAAFKRTTRHLLALVGGTVFLCLSAAADIAEEKKEVAHAIFAGGCFWCMEPPFEKLDGVDWVKSGYIGGDPKKATYKAVSRGGTGHYEAVKIQYDPTKVDYATLLEIFWKNIDPFDSAGQFCDKGSQYLSGIFYLDEEQKRLANASLAKIKNKNLEDKPIATEVLNATKFYDAEAYHQDYYKKNPIRYRFYRSGCGRDARLQEIWG